MGSPTVDPLWWRCGIHNGWALLTGLNNGVKKVCVLKGLSERKQVRHNSLSFNLDCGPRSTTPKAMNKPPASQDDQTTQERPPVSVVCEAAREAGALALRYFGKSPKTWNKPGNSPVTEADLAIDTMLHNALRKAYPGYGWLSEEIDDDGSRLEGGPTFIVDPIDGTRGFIAGTDDWAVSIALVDNGDPVLSALFNPVTGKLIFAEAGEGAFCEDADGSVARLKPTGKADLHDALLAYPGPPRPSQPYSKAPKLASLALRLAEVATGRFDGCVARPGAKHWDIAAADLIVREAGLKLTDKAGRARVYDGEDIRHPALVCGSDALTDLLALQLPDPF